MTVLAETENYLVEYDQCGSFRMLTITDKWNGFAKSLFGPRIAGDFRDCLKTHSPEKAIETWLRIANDQSWEKVYKPMVLAIRPLGFLD